MNLYIPRDKETDKPKGFAFAEYESEEIAEYAVKLFSGLVTLYNRTLRFAVCPPISVVAYILACACKMSYRIICINHHMPNRYIKIKLEGITVIVIYIL